MRRLSNEDWELAHQVALDIHRAKSLVDLLDTLRNAVPNILGVSCRVLYAPKPTGTRAACPHAAPTTASQINSSDSERRLGPFLVQWEGFPEKGGRELLELIAEHAVIAWEKSGSPELVARCHPAYQKFTRRQREVLPLLVRGMTNAEIGYELHISPRTVEKHVAAICRLLGAQGRSGFARVEHSESKNRVALPIAKPLAPFLFS